MANYRRFGVLLRSIYFRMGALHLRSLVDVVFVCVLRRHWRMPSWPLTAESPQRTSSRNWCRSPGVPLRSPPFKKWQTRTTVSGSLNNGGFQLPVSWCTVLLMTISLTLSRSMLFVLSSVQWTQRRRRYFMRRPRWPSRSCSCAMDRIRTLASKPLLAGKLNVFVFGISNLSHWNNLPHQEEIYLELIPITVILLLS